METRTVALLVFVAAAGCLPDFPTNDSSNIGGGGDPDLATAPNPDPTQAPPDLATPSSPSPDLSMHSSSPDLSMHSASPDLSMRAAPDLAQAPSPDLAGVTPPDLTGAPPPDLAQPPSPDLAIACDPLQSTAGLSDPTGHHNAGASCMGCHAPGGGAITFYVGGTLYNAVSGGAAVAGATINVTDAAGTKLKIITANNGNFWTTTALSYPLTVDASLCPSTIAMSSTVASPGGCNNCHTSTFRVHVP
jgi:hypothetical protein